MSIKPRSEKDSQTNHEDRHISYNPRVQHRRPTSAYTLEGLLSLPTRLLHPPPLPMRSSATKIDSVVKEERGTSSTSLRKWWPRSPSGLVELSDVLQNLHFSPLSARDFEDFLVYDEHSPENLYFYYWIEAYTKLFIQENKHLKIQDSRIHPVSNPIHEKFHLGLNTFFSDGALELNIPGNTRQTVLERARETMEPSIFDTVRRDVVEMLEESKKRWLSKQSGNANKKRRAFGFTLGSLCIVLAIVLNSCVIVFTRYRTLRLVSAPLVWFGAMIIFQCFKNTCIIIYAFGNFRQLHPWELLRLKSDNRLEEASSESLRSCDATSLSAFCHDDWRPAQRLNESTPVFSPQTKVESPLMKRILRYNVLSGASWALLVTVLWIAIWLPLPLLKK